MGAHGSKEKLSRTYSERIINTQVIERERFGSFGKRASKGSLTIGIHRQLRIIYFITSHNLPICSCL